MYNTNKILLYYMYGKQRINVKEFFKKIKKIFEKKKYFFEISNLFRSWKHRIKGKTGENRWKLGEKCIKT